MARVFNMGSLRVFGTGRANVFKIGDNGDLVDLGFSIVYKATTPKRSDYMVLIDRSERIKEFERKIFQIRCSPN